MENEEAESKLVKWVTPSEPATKNYVERGKLDKTIFREFSQQGRQVLVFGPTGAGKTSMVLDNLEKLKNIYKTTSVRVTMTSTTTIESFIGDVAAKLHLTRQVQQIDTSEASQHAEGEFSLRWLSTNLGEQSKDTQQTVREPYTGSNDFAILEEVLFERNTVLVVDDMENLSSGADELRVRLAEIAKNMSDDAINYENSYAKIVFVGIASTATQLWTDVQSLKSRLATIAVPYVREHKEELLLKKAEN